MAANIKISQLPNINANLSNVSLLPIVSVNGAATTDKTTVKQLGDYIQAEAGNLIIAPNIANLSYNVINAAQPNITSVGTLTGLTVVGTSNIGYPNNVVILGGVAGQVLSTDGNGSIGWIDQIGATGATGPRGDTYATESTSNLTISTGNITLTVDTGLAYTVGQDITVSHDPNNYMAGPILTYDSANGELVFDSITVAGTGSYNIWYVNLDGAVGAVGATGSTGPEGSTGPVGATGATGIQGLEGATGPTGPVGATGAFLGIFTSNVDANGFSISNAANITANFFNGVASNVNVTAVNNNYSYHMAFVTGPGDSCLHMDADDNLQYNPQDGILTVTRADAQFLSVTNSVLSNLVPFDSLPISLGNANNRWQDLYLSNSTIYLGNATIGANGNSIVVDSITVTGSNIGTIGNIAGINIDGNASNILYGNGVFADALTTVGATGATGVAGVDGATGATGTAGVDGATGATGPVAGSNTQVIFNDDGNAGASANLRFDSANNVLYINGNLDVSDYIIGSGNLTLYNISSADESQLSLSGSGVSILTDDGNREWIFDTTGTLTAPGDITVSGDITGTAGANTLVLKAQPNTNTYIQLNSIVDSTIRIDANLEIITDSSNTSQSWTFDIAGNLTLPGNTFSINYANGSQASAPLVDVLNTNGLTTVFYPTFVENRTDGQIVRADVDLSYRSDTNTLTVGNITGNTNGYTLGYLNIPQVAASNTTLALTDAGKHYYSTTAGNLTLTIPLNSSVAFPTGTAVSIVVQAAGNVLVNAAAGVTLYMAGSSTAGNRVVGTYGMATLMKVASDTWFINGTGVY